MSICNEFATKKICFSQFAQQSKEESMKELESATLKQRAYVEDVKRSVAIAGSESNKKTQIAEITKQRTIYSDKVRALSDQNRKTIRQLSEEITPRLKAIQSKIERLENSKNIKLEVRICVKHFYLLTK